MKRRRRKNSRRGKRFTERPIAYVLEMAVSLALLGVFGRSFYAFAQTAPDFRVRMIQTEGLQKLTGREIVDASGITTADSLLFLDFARARANVERLPFVASCEIRVTFPDLVVIAIEERAPFASLLVHSRLFLIDQHGIVLREVPQNAMPMQPIISNVEGLQFVSVGESLEIPALRDAIALWDALRASEFVQENTVSEIAAFSSDDLQVYCDEIPFALRWRRGDFAAQAARLDRLWELKGHELDCPNSLDLRFGQDLVCN